MKKYLFAFLLIVFSIQHVKAQQPKLVIGIVVDQMRYDYLYRYWNRYGDGGFKKLVNEGFSCENTNYNYVPTYTAPGHTSIYTGAGPAMHGIVGNNWYVREKKMYTYCTDDSTVKTVGAAGKAGMMSPRNMLSTTICDELRLSNNKQSKVIGIALKDRGAILPAGHTANAAYWYDGKSGNWISSTFYMNELPTWVQQFNSKGLAQKYLTKPWETLYPLASYTVSFSDDNAYEGKFKGELKPVFPHNLPTLLAENGGLDLLKSTPFGNSFTKDFAIETIKAEGLGKDAITDFLCISFSSTDYVGHRYGVSSVETEDSYLRLDRDLADLILFLDTEVGKNNYLLFLTADHAAPEAPSYLQSLRVPAGYINDEEMLKAIREKTKEMYGDSLVLAYYNQQVYLNLPIIQKRNLNLAEVERSVAAIITPFQGVSFCVTSSQLKDGSYSNGPKMLIQNGYYEKRCGNVFVNYEANWMEHERTGTTHGSAYSYDTHVPLVWYGAGIPFGKTTDAIHITDIAPTVAMLLHIQFPSSSIGVPIKKIFNSK